MSAIERPGISSAEKNVPSTNAVSVASARKLFESAVPLLPFVDVGEPENFSVRAPDQEGHRVGVLVAVRNRDRRDVQAGRERDLDTRLDLPDRDVALRDEPAPRTILAEEPGHRRRAEDRHAAGAEDLAAELRQPQVVPDVRVCEEDSVGPAAEPLHLRGEVGGGVDEEAFARSAVDQTQGGHEHRAGRGPAAPRRRGPAGSPRGARPRPGRRRGPRPRGPVLASGEDG